MNKIAVLPPNSNIVHQHGKISTVLSLPTFRQSIVEFINSFGQLYYGTMQSELFYKLIRQTKQQFLRDLKNIQTINNEQPVGFKLHLCRIAVNESWRLPALINQSESNLQWKTGQGRFLATGMCLPEPHTKLKFLLLQDKNTQPNYFLQDPKPITTDQELHEILNLPAGDGNVEMEFQLEQHGSQLMLASLYNGDQLHHYDAGTMYLDRFKAWQQTYGTQPTLHIYTNWPELIVDSANVWSIKHQGPSPVTKTENFRIGYLERQMFDQVGNPTHGQDHVLYVADSRPIDVSDLLCWVDLTHSAYINANAQFALFRPNKKYVTTLIDVSYFK